MRSLMSDNLTILTISRLSRAMMSRDVPAGTNTPIHASPLMSGKPASAKVGTSGSAGERVLPDTASARSLPSLTNGAAGGNPPNEIGVCPATAEPIAKPPLLNGTWDKIESLRQTQLLGHEVRRRPDPSRGVVVFARISLDESHEIFDGLHRQRRMHCDDTRDVRCQDDRIEVLVRVIGNALVKRRVDDEQI